MPVAPAERADRYGLDDHHATTRLPERWSTFAAALSEPKATAQQGDDVIIKLRLLNDFLGFARSNSH